jgi:predicted membrane channel-forming protein YqfA (hemolysin III family)
MASFLNICLQIPNLGTIGFILLFIFAIPLVLFYTSMLELLQLYAPFVVMLASTLTQSGKPHIFKELYQINPKNPTAFLSANLINLFTLIGILWYSVGIALYHNNLELGVSIATISFIISFPIAREAIPYLIREGDERLKENTTFDYPYNWHKYFIGFLTIGSLLILQYILIGLMIQAS